MGDVFEVSWHPYFILAQLVLVPASLLGGLLAGVVVDMEVWHGRGLGLGWRGLWHLWLVVMLVVQVAHILLVLSLSTERPLMLLLSALPSPLLLLPLFGGQAVTDSSIESIRLRLISKVQSDHLVLSLKLVEEGHGGCVDKLVV